MTYARKTLSEIKLIHGDYGNFIKGQKLQKDKEKKYKTPPYQDLAASTEVEGEFLDEKCWKGYKKKGMKTMFGKRYPNCVKVKKEDWRSDLGLIDEKAVSQQQQKFFGMVRATQKGEMDNPSDEVQKAADSMTKKDVKKYASTKHDKLPKKIEEKLDSEDKPFVKHLVKKLRSGSKTHAKQADDLEKAMKENVMLTYKSGQGFDAKIGNRSVRNTVSNFKTGVDAVKNIKKEKGIVKGIKKTINDKKSTNTKTDVSTNVDDAIKNFKMKEDTAIESELTIQDWNVDDIKFTEIEAVDIIKPKPLKPSPSNWINEIELDEGFKQRIIAKFGKKLIKKIGKVNPFTKTGAQRVTGNVIKKTTPKVKGAFDVTGTQAAQMKRSKGGIKFPVKDATSKQISKNIQTKSIVNQTKKANELGMKKLSNKKSLSGKDLSKPIKVNLSKPIDFDKYLGTTPNKVQKKFGSTKPTGTFTDDLPPVKTVPLNKSQLDLMKKTTPKKIKKKVKMKDKLKEIENDPMSKLIKKQIESETGTKTRKFSQKSGVTKGNENEILSNKKPKKPLKDHYDWRNELDEDWQKVNRKDKTDGMSQKAVNAYRKENPGSKLKTAVTKDPKKLKKGSKSAKRRLAFCRRMKGMKKKLTSAKTRRDPDSRINKALRRWNC